MHTYTFTHALLSSLKKTISNVCLLKIQLFALSFLYLEASSPCKHTRGSLCCFARPLPAYGGGGAGGKGVWEYARLLLVPLPWLGTWYLPRSSSSWEARKEKATVGVAAALHGTGAKPQSRTNFSHLRLTSGPAVQMLAAGEFLHARRPKS